MSETPESKIEISSEVKPLSLQDLNTRRLDALEVLAHLERQDRLHSTEDSRAAVRAKRLEIENILQQTLELMDAELDELVAKEKRDGQLSEEEQLHLQELHTMIEITVSRRKIMHGDQGNLNSDL